MKKGRQKLDESVKRSHYINVAFNADELALIQSRALDSNARKSIYVREAALNRLPKLVSELNKDRWIELSRSAANLNQIARSLNEMRYSNQANIDIAEIQRALLDFRSALINK